MKEKKEKPFKMGYHLRSKVGRNNVVSTFSCNCKRSIFKEDNID